MADGEGEAHLRCIIYLLLKICVVIRKYTVSSIIWYLIINCILFVASIIVYIDQLRVSILIFDGFDDVKLDVCCVI